MPSPDDETWMRAALDEARGCLRTGAPSDVPVGAVCVLDGQVIARAGNRREIDSDPLAHAEALALRAASQVLGERLLHAATLYVTLEPCPMCAGAIWLSRIQRVVFGAWDDKAGACGSVLDIARDPRLNHRPQLLGGVLQAECEEILRGFFVARRAQL